MTERYYNIQQVAELIGRTPNAVRTLRQTGDAPRFVKLHGRLVVSETDLESWIKEGLEDA